MEVRLRDVLAISWGSRSFSGPVWMRVAWAVTEDVVGGAKRSQNISCHGNCFSLLGSTLCTFRDVFTGGICGAYGAMSRIAKFQKASGSTKALTMLRLSTTNRVSIADRGTKMD